MRLRLLSLTTLAASAAFTAPAMAADWALSLGAHVEQTLGYASYDGPTTAPFEGADAVSTGAFFALPTITTNSGLTFGALIEIEGHIGERNAGAAFDEASVFVQSAFGQLLIGKSDTPGNHMQYGAPASYGPDVNFVGLSTAALPSLLQFSNVHNNRFVGDDLLRGTLGSTFVSNQGKETQGRITYISPTFSGFRVGASYAPYEANGAPNRDDAFDIGASYARSIGAVDLGLSAKWGIADNRAVPGADPEYWGAGINATFGALSIGGSFAESTGSAGGVTDGQAFDIGARYETGRFGFSLHYLNGENIDDENFALGAKESFQAATFAVDYDLMGRAADISASPKPGDDLAAGYSGPDGMQATVFGFVSYADFNEDLGDAGLGTQGDDVDGFVVGTGIRLSF